MAIGPLRRVVGRVDGRDVPEAAAQDCFAGGGLLGNAFAVPGVGRDASVQAISEAHRRSSRPRMTWTL